MAEQSKAKFKRLKSHPVINRSLNTIAKHEFAAPFFVFRETLAGFVRHNVMSLSASLSFYALFALIPLVLLIFYLLSHVVYNSDYAIVKLAIITSNLVPDLSASIMTEVHNASKTKRAWEALGLLVLLWAIMPLATAMRTSFYTISGKREKPSYLKGKVRDIVSVIGILLLFFLFTAAGLAIETVISFFAEHTHASVLKSVTSLLTLIITSFLIAGFYRVFFPIRVIFPHLLLGGFVTAILWLLMRYGFSLFLAFNKNYGAVFGSMKTLFISVSWLYLTFAVLLLGTELIATLKKKDVLLLRGLFDDIPNKATYIAELVKLYGKNLKQGDVIIEAGDTEQNLYFIVHGSIHLTVNGETSRILNANDYFGEVSALSKLPQKTSAIVGSEEAQIIVIYAENVDTMLNEYPEITKHLLTHMANQIYDS